jgi:6,7-dimethyl-8-ribityllumazine synthase
MSSALKNLSTYNPDSIPDASQMQFAIAVAEWNDEITGALLEGALNTLKKHGAKEANILVKTVPGSFELPVAATLFAENTQADAIICLGCVIQGETKHFDFICNSVAQGLTDLSVKYKKSFIFGVLTPNTLEQAQDRAGGKHGNKGDEAAVTAIKMVALAKELKKHTPVKGFGK